MQSDGSEEAIDMSVGRAIAAVCCRSFALCVSYAAADGRLMGERRRIVWRGYGRRKG